MPFSKRLGQILLCSHRWVLLPLGSIFYGKPIDAASGHRDNAESAASSPRLAHSWLNIGAIHNRAPRRITRITNRDLSEELAADDTPEPVRRDHSVRTGNVAGVKLRRYAFGILAYPDASLSQMNTARFHMTAEKRQ